jgi:acyl-CoA thioester hydrolase
VATHLMDNVIRQFLVAQCGLSDEVVSSLKWIDFGYEVCSEHIAFPVDVEVGLRVLYLSETSVLYEVGVFARGQNRPLMVGGYRHVWDEPMSRSTREQLETLLGTGAPSAGT